MILSDGQSLNFMVTPNHDMVTTTGKIEAGDMLMQATSVAKFHIPLALDGTKPDLGGISDEQIRLVGAFLCDGSGRARSEEHTSELQSLMRTSYAVFCLKKKKQTTTISI